jgi:hypothetical protein
VRIEQLQRPNQLFSAKVTFSVTFGLDILGLSSLTQAQ